jgi:hypothetical protein
MIPLLSLRGFHKNQGIGIPHSGTAMKNQITEIIENLSLATVIVNCDLEFVWSLAFEFCDLKNFITANSFLGCYITQFLNCSSFIAE